MAVRSEPLTLRYYSNQVRVGVIEILVNAITGGAAAVLCVHAILELPIFA